MRVVVHVDGGARGNPGPAAAAAVLTRRRVGRGARRGDRATSATTTNNVAEYRGLLLGLERAARAGRRRGRGRQRLRADRQAGQRRVQGQAPRHEGLARGGAGRAVGVRALVDPLGAARAERRTPTRWSTRRWTPPRSSAAACRSRGRRASSCRTGRSCSAGACSGRPVPWWPGEADLALQGLDVARGGRVEAGQREVVALLGQPAGGDGLGQAGVELGADGGEHLVRRLAELLGQAGGEVGLDGVVVRLRRGLRAWRARTSARRRRSRRGARWCAARGLLAARACARGAARQALSAAVSSGVRPAAVSCLARSSASVCLIAVRRSAGSTLRRWARLSSDAPSSPAPRKPAGLPVAVDLGRRRAPRGRASPPLPWANATALALSATMQAGGQDGEQTTGHAVLVAPARARQTRWRQARRRRGGQRDDLDAGGVEDVLAVEDRVAAAVVQAR